MIITDKLINDIFTLKIKIKDNNKIKLSKYQEIIPMYDIYSQEIYPIMKKNLHYRLIESDYRFINQEIYEWLQNLYKKYKDDDILARKFKKNLDIMNNYDIDTLIITSYKTLYEYSPMLGLLVSICKRKSFNPYITHLKPYYTKIELIKLGQNMNLIKTINIEKLLNKEYHYNFCKKISSNDISSDEITIHIQHIIDTDIISYITFYSFYGSFLYNKVLRNKNKINTFLYNGIISIINSITNSPQLNNNYYMYRFIWDDNFIKDLNIGDYFIDNGFLSTTRDPFYSPGINLTFGLTLIKINIPKNTSGIGLIIENFSLFPKEEEFLFNPNTKFKLLFKDNDFKYYHTNKQFENMITKKYELEFIEYIPIKLKEIKNNYKIISNLSKYELYGNERLILFKQFIQESFQIKFTLNNKEYIIICMFFDSSDNSSYNRLYYNKIKNGLSICIFDHGYPYLNIECGNDMIVNYINQFYFYKDSKNELNLELLNIILEFGRIFYYKEAKIFHNYRNFSEFKLNYTNNLFIYTNFYNHTIYNYAKNKIKFLNYDFIQYKMGWYVLDQILDTTLSTKIKNKYKLHHINTIRESLIYIVENNFIIYDKFFKDIIFKLNNNNYLVFEIYEKLNYQNRIDNFKSINFIEDNLGDDFKLIFRQPLRRF